MLGWKPQQNVFLKNTLDSVILLSLIFSYTLIFLVVARIITKTLKKKCSSKCYLLLHKFHCQSSKYLKVLSHPTLPGYLEWNCPIFPYSPVLLSSLFIHYPLRFFI